MKTVTIGKNDDSQRLDKFISKYTVGLPMGLMYKFIRKKRIKVNGARAKENTMLRLGDTVEMYIPDEFFPASGVDSYAAVRQSLASVKNYPDIVYEDENIILCNKRPGVLVHDGDDAGKGSVGTLIHSVQAYLYAKGEYDPAAEASFAPSLCNRIDRNTGGIVIAAKNAAALREMNELIRVGGVNKKYLCAVHGKTDSRGVIKGYIFKNTKTKTVTVYDEPRQGAKEAVTEYTALAYDSHLRLTLLEVRLITGRTHQIRAHFAHIGHPLLGEGKYAVNRDDARMGWSHQALYSYKLDFSVPGEGVLHYLDGKEFTVPAEDVKFLKYFENIPDIGLK